MKKQDVVIVSAKRTPLGAFGGQLASLKATELGSHVIGALLEETSIDPTAIESLCMGCVLTAGLRQAPARQAAIGGGLPASIPCSTVNKVCGSSLQTIIYGCNELQATSSNCVIVGGMESMSQAPYLLPNARFGQRLGHGQAIDHLFYDGLENAYGEHGLMGCFAEKTSQHYGFSREALDAFSIESTKRALSAQQAGHFKSEISPIMVKRRKSTECVSEDEGPSNAKPEKIPTLKPAFSSDGVTTAGNASSISDGAAALMLMTREAAEAEGYTPLAKIAGFSAFAHEPEWFTTAPIGAIGQLLKSLNWTTQDVDLYEINEAFAVVTLVTMQALKLDHDRVNIYGGAVALGHPIGATGSRLIVTLLNQLTRENKETGVVSACIGGGEALAIAIERLN